MNRASHVLILACLLVFPRAAWAEGEEPASDVDSLFNAPAEDTVSVESKSGVIDDFVKSGMLVTGTYTATGGFVYGWAERPYFIEAFTDLKDGRWDGFVNYMLMDTSLTALYGFTSKMDFEVRPDRNTRVKGNIAIAYPAWSLAVGDLFLDYSLEDSLFFRAGRFAVTWGNARYYGVDNLPGRIPVGVHASNGTVDADGVSLKLDVPLGAHSLSALVLERNGYHAAAGSPLPTEFGYGLKGDLVWGSTEFVLGGFYQQYLRPRALLSAKTLLFGVDLGGECIATCAGADGLLLSWLAGVFWEQADWKLSVYGEYLYNAEKAAAEGHEPTSGSPPGSSVAFLLGWKDLLGTRLKAGLQWQHAFEDGSGFLLPALSLEAAPHVTVSLGIWKSYGPVDGYLVSSNVDGAKRRTMILFKTTVSGGF